MVLTRVFVLDGDRVFPEEAANFLANVPQVELVGRSRSLKDAIQQIESIEPDVVLTALEFTEDHEEAGSFPLPGIYGLLAASRLKAMLRPPRVVIISNQADAKYSVLAQIVQADGFLTKADYRLKLPNLLASLDRSPRLTSNGNGNHPGPSNGNGKHHGDVESLIDSLAPEERDVLHCILEGLPNKAIANRLALSARTVDRRRHAIMRKLNCSSVAELVATVVNAKRE